MKNVKRFVLFVGVGMVALGAFMPLPSYAQSSREITNRLDRIENDIQTLNHAVYRGGGSGASLGGGSQDTAALANAEIRMQQLESELRELRGLIEQQGYEVRKMREQMDRMASDVDVRFGSLEKKNTTSTPSSVSVSGGSSDTSVYSSGQQVLNANESVVHTQASKAQTLGTISSGKASDSAAGLYENAFSLLKAANYNAAGSEFQSFLDQYPHHVLSGNAKYWLGETFYVRGNFEKAARIFAEGFQTYPNSAKAADYLLKLGMSLANMGKTDDACVALSQLEKEDYKNAAPVLRRAEQERARLKCQ